MALINIKDLPQSVELDRKAMLAIVGGARASRPAGLVATVPRSNRIVDYPPGFARYFMKKALQPLQPAP